MARAVTETCTHHPNRRDCGDILIDRRDSDGRFGIIIHDGGSALSLIDYCPWCGAVLNV